MSASEYTLLLDKNGENLLFALREAIKILSTLETRDTVLSFPDQATLARAWDFIKRDTQINYTIIPIIRNEGSASICPHFIYSVGSHRPKEEQATCSLQVKYDKPPHSRVFYFIYATSNARNDNSENGNKLHTGDRGMVSKVTFRERLSWLYGKDRREKRK